MPQAAPPDPASTQPKPSDIQVGGKQYTKVAGLTWVERESTKPDSFADVSVGPNDLQSKDQPSPLKTAKAPKAPKRVVVGPHYYDRAPQPLQAFIDTVMLPFDFLSLPRAPRLVNVVSLRGSILRRTHWRNAAYADRLSGCNCDRHSGMEETPTLDAVDCRSRCWRDCLDLPE